MPTLPFSTPVSSSAIHWWRPSLVWVLSGPAGPLIIGGLVFAGLTAGAAAAQQELPQVPGISLHGAVDDQEAAPDAKPEVKPQAKPAGDGQAAGTSAKKDAAAKPAANKAGAGAGGAAAKPPAQEGQKAKSGTAKPDKTAAAKESAKAKSGSKSIAILVNDDPITGYEIEQRASFIALSSGALGEGFKARAESRWQSIIKDPRTNERFKELLREKGVRTQEEARELQTQFVKDLQRNMVEGLKREARAAAVSGSKSKAQDELIDEKLKLQEAKRLSVSASEAEVDNVITGIAERNKMTLAQFGQHMKSMGVDIATMRSRFMAELSWREVVRRRFGHQITITDRDVDRLVAANPGGEEDVELQLQRISIFTPPNADQKAVAQKLGEAQTAAGNFSGCTSTKALAAQIPGARFEDLGWRRPSAIAEPTRSMLLNARDGDLLPPAVGQGSVELWAVCGRKTVTANEQKREEAKAELRSKEFEIMARKHLKDLRQDAAIEYR